MQQKHNQALTIMVPAHSYNLKKHLETMTNTSHQGFLGMIKFVNLDSVLNKVKKAFRAEGFEHIVLEKQDDQIVFGYGTDLYTIKNESDLTRLLFGPLKTTDLDFMKPETQLKLATLLPLPLWIWGWDSI